MFVCTHQRHRPTKMARTFKVFRFSKNPFRVIFSSIQAIKKCKKNRKKIFLKENTPLIYANASKEKGEHRKQNAFTQRKVSAQILHGSYEKQEKF